MRTLSVDWDHFEEAFVIGSPDARYFLHVHTGEVAYIGPMDGPTVRQRVMTRVEAEGWVEIPRPSLADALEEIRGFAAAEVDEEVRERLLAALRDPRPPVAFNRALGRDRALRRRWAAWRDRAIAARLVAFCERHDIQPDDPRYGDARRRAGKASAASGGDSAG